MLDRMNAGQGVDVRDHRRQPVGPFICTLVIGNQVLSHLDQDMGEALSRRMAVHGVVLEGAVIRFIIANRQISVFAQQRQKRLYGAVVLVPEKADLPGRTFSFQRGVKEWIETMKGAALLSAAVRSLARATVS